MTNAAADTRDAAGGRPAGPLRLVLVGVAFAALCAGFIALGTWQVQRLAWKLDLIARVDARVHAPPAAPPARTDWPAIDARRDAYEYRHVLLRGRYLPGRDTRVQAVTELGPGWWVLTPFVLEGGDVVLVNRGFVPQDARATPADAAPRAVAGLLRISEPHGGFLRRNRPADGRWYSRDVQAIARARGLAGVAPYFVDADAHADAGDWPRGGMTVVRFRNQHLQYAITWFALALLTLVGAGIWLRHEATLRRARVAATHATDARR